MIADTFCSVNPLTKGAASVFLLQAKPGQERPGRVRSGYELVWDLPMLIAFEGGDGCGKSTQAERLEEALRQAGRPVQLVSFPRYASPVYGMLIRKYLDGQLGESGQVHPYWVALAFAGDRAAEAANLRQLLCEDKIVIVDRYFYSNLVYQGAKFDDYAERNEFASWLRRLEFGISAIPEPDLSIYLDVHHYDRGQAVEQRETPRGAVHNDIHERDPLLQEKVEELFRYYSQQRQDLARIDCQQFGRRLSADEVHARVVRVLEARGLLPAGLIPLADDAGR